MGIDLSLRMLRSFVVVGRLEHIGRAADELFISQPALSKQMKKLELLLGVPLFERVGRRVRLTNAGRVLLDEATALIGHADASVRRVRMAHLGANPVVKLAYIPPMPIQYTTGLLRGAPASDGIEVSLRRINWSEKYTLLRSGDVDLTLIRLPIEDEGISYAVLEEEARVAVFGHEHRYADSAALSMADLTNEPIAEMSNQRDYWCVNPRPDGSTPNFGPKVSSVDEMLELAAAGHAMSFISSTVQHYLHRDDVAYVPVRDLPPARIVVAWIDDLLSAAGQRIRDALIAMSRLEDGAESEIADLNR